VVPVYSLLISLGLGVLFLFEDLYNNHSRIHPSLIAGISLSYFFLIVLPEVLDGLPEFGAEYESFEYAFFLFGFAFVHIIEKFIVQNVEAKSQKKVRELSKSEKLLEVVEDNITGILTTELNDENLNEMALRELATTITSLKKQEDEFNKQIIEEKEKITKHLNKDLAELRFFIKFFYHFFIGFILFNLLLLNLLSGIMFFVFAFFMALLQNKPAYQIFSDIEIKIKYNHNKVIHLLEGFSTLIGLGIAIIFAEFAPITLENVFFIFSFVTGIILYRIVREVIPEKEKGKPIFFIIGIIGFTILKFSLNLLIHH
jgi:zinc transporter ZupT